MDEGGEECNLHAGTCCVPMYSCPTAPMRCPDAVSEGTAPERFEPESRCPRETHPRATRCDGSADHEPRIHIHYDWAKPCVCVPRESLPEVLPAPTRRSFWLELTKAPPLSSSSDRRYTTDMHSKRVPCHVSPLASTPIWRLPLCLPSSLGQNKHTRRCGS